MEPVLQKENTKLLYLMMSDFFSEQIENYFFPKK